MIIEESVLISSQVKIVWDTFTDLTCWRDWCTVLDDVSASTDRMTKGKSFKFCIRPFDIPIHLQPVVEEVIPEKHIVWTGKKLGLSARHEFTFEEKDGGTLIKSKETFSGILISSMHLIFPKKKLQELSSMMLKEIKEASENNRGPHPDSGVIWEKKLSK
jgi:hypothetical protein